MCVGKEEVVVKRGWLFLCVVISLAGGTSLYAQNKLEYALDTSGNYFHPVGDFANYSYGAVGFDVRALLQPIWNAPAYLMLQGNLLYHLTGATAADMTNLGITFGGMVEMPLRGQVGAGTSLSYGLMMHIVRGEWPALRESDRELAVYYDQVIIASSEFRWRVASGGVFYVRPSYMIMIEETTFGILLGVQVGTRIYPGRGNRRRWDLPYIPRAPNPNPITGQN